jgi:hypothetical protein
MLTPKSVNGLQAEMVKTLAGTVLVVPRVEDNGYIGEAVAGP